MDFIEDLGCGIYKIASFEMTFHDLLTAVASTKKPIILSTGMATEDEIAASLEVLDRAGSGPVVLLHCCSSYPAPVEEVNLAAMAAMRDRFGRMVGFSDHTIGATVPLAVAAMGAVALEKHFTDDTARPGPDHRFSATPEVLRQIATGVRDIHAALGDGVKRTTEAERASKAFGRRSAFALRDLAAGAALTPADFRFIRPNAGVPADRPEVMVDRRLKAAVKAGDPIREEDLA